MKSSGLRIIAIALIVLFCSQARAETVEVAPGVSVTKKTYPVELSEAPFFNFATKNDKHKEADRKFVSGILSEVPDRAEAARRASGRGWDYVQQGDFVTAAKRFNQAHLLDPMDSALYHGFAVVVFERFRDVDYADELFKIAARMNSPFRTLSGDHGRVLLMAGRPAEAKPLLEQGTRDLPESAVPQVNLARSMWETGDSDGACRLIAKVTQSNRAVMENDIGLLRKYAKCN